MEKTTPEKQTRVEELEQELKRCKNRLRHFEHLFEKSGIIRMEYHPDSGRLESWGLRDLLGYSPDEVGDMLDDWLSLMEPDTRSRWREVLLGLCARNPLSCSMSCSFLSRTGKRLPFHSRWVSVPGDGYLTGILIDATQDPEFYEDPETERYRLLFDHIPIGVVLYKPVDNGNDFVFEDINIAGQQISQVIREEILGRTITDTFPGVREFGLFEAMQQTLKTGEPNHVPLKEYRDNRIAQFVENDVYMIPGNKIMVLFNDQTEREVMIDDLREQRQRMDLIVTAAELGIWDWNVQTGETVFNRQWSEMLGYSQDEVVQSVSFWSKILHPDDQERVTGELNQHLEGTTPLYQCEQRLLCRDGSYKWILDTGKVVEWDSEGKPLRAVGVHQDISNRKKMESDLREREIRLRHAFENAVTGMLITAPDLSIRYYNKAFYCMLGYSHDELNQMNILDLTHPEDREMTREHMDDLLSYREMAVVYEKRFVTRQGLTVWVKTNAAMVRDEDGNPLYMVKQVVDMTAEELTRQKLNHQIHFLQSLIDSITFPVFFKDIHGTYQLCNTAFCNFAGKPREEIIGSNVWDLFPHQDAEIFDQKNREVIEHQTEKIFEVPSSSSHGRHLVVHEIPYKDADGKLTGLVANFIDITDRKKAEMTRIELETFRERSLRLASLGTLAGGIAHEINQPLTVMKAEVDGLLIRRRYRQKISPLEYQEAIEIIGEEIARIQDIIEHMRSLIHSRDASHAKPTMIDEVIRNALSVVGQQMKSHRIVLDYTGEINLPPVRINPTALEQVLINLMVNAMQSLDTLPEHAGRIQLITRLDKPDVLIIIRDNGPGIPQEHIHKVFDPFFTTRVRSQGMGLGLTIVENFVKSMNGRIHVRNHEKGGAEFTIRIPVQAEGQI